MLEALEGLAVTAALDGHDLDALLDAFHDDPGYSQPSEEDYAAWQQSSQFQPDLWQVAWDGDFDNGVGAVAGMVLNYITHESSAAAEPGTAWTEDAKPWIAKGPSGIAVRSLIEFVQGWAQAQ